MTCDSGVIGRGFLIVYDAVADPGNFKFFWLRFKAYHFMNYLSMNYSDKNEYFFTRHSEAFPIHF